MKLLRHPRTAALLLVLLQLAPILATAHHTEDPDRRKVNPDETLGPGFTTTGPIFLPTEEEVKENATTGVPLVDGTRDLVLAKQKAAVDNLTAELRRFGVTGNYLPATASNAFNDSADPGTRVGGIGDWTAIGKGWSVVQGAGWNGSAGWTTTDPKTGDYPPDSVQYLVTPAIDLSAWPLKTGQIPFGGSYVSDKSNATCISYVESVESVIQAGGSLPKSWCWDVAGQGVKPPTAGGSPLKDQVNLVLRHRFNLPTGMDGAQVRVFQREPTATSVGFEPGELLEPMPLERAYAERVNAFGAAGAPGYTGAQGWEDTAFDLTSYAGRTVWIAFVLASGRTLDAESYPDPKAPRGWQIDDIQVRSPAVGEDLKVWGIEGPHFRIDERDRIDRVAAGTQFNVSPIVLNAGAYAAVANVTVDVVYESRDPVRRSVNKTMQPGEVWSPSFAIDAPGVEHEDFTVTARATGVVITLGGSGGSTTDLSQNNEASKVFSTRNFTRLSLQLEPSEVRTDEASIEVATASVRNTGNVPASVTLSLVESYLTLNQTTGLKDERVRNPYPPVNLTIPPGGTVSRNWTVSTSVRGEHLLTATVESQGAETLTANAAYYVHASPPPLLVAGSGVAPDPAEWPMTDLSAMPPPGEDNHWAWYVNGNVGVDTLDQLGRATLVIRPRLCSTTQPVSQAGRVCVPSQDFERVEYTDLQLSMRYSFQTQAANPVPPMTLTLGYYGPFPTVTPPGSQTTVLQDAQSYRAIWSRDFAVMPDTSRLGYELASTTWRNVVDVPVEPAAEDGYIDLWSLDGLELRLTSPFLAPSVLIFLDHLELTGVPVGKDESWRRTIAFATGEETDGSVTTAVPDVRDPQTQSECNVSGQRPPGQCWEKINLTKEQGKKTVEWHATASTFRGEQAAFEYNTPLRKLDTRTPAQAITSPPIFLGSADDPTLFLDHAYYFESYPLRSSSEGPNACIFQVGLVEVQYQLDDGSWSDRIRIIPDAPDGTLGYPSVLQKTPLGEPRPSKRDCPTPPDQLFGFASPDSDVETGGDGFYYPLPCSITQECQHGGYWQNAAGVNDPTLHLTYYTPSPHEETSVFHLKRQPGLEGVDLRNRNIMLSFVASSLSRSNTGHGYWMLGGIKMLPFSDFAIDGAVTGIEIDTPYDWRAIGVGPGTKVTVNVTVQNKGLYPEAFNVNLNVTPRGSHKGVTIPVELGTLLANETRHVLIPWSVPEDEDMEYELRANITSAADPRIDEFRFNNNLTIGLDGSIVARTRKDLAIEARVTPTTAAAGFGRQVRIAVENLGNVPIERATIYRNYTQVTQNGVIPVAQSASRTWELTGLPVRAGATSLISLLPDFDPDDFIFVPDPEGIYHVVVDAKVDDDLEDKNNHADVTVFAIESIYSDDFDGRLRWTTDRPDVWQPGRGFESAGSIQAGNDATGTLPPGSDVSIVSPLLRLSDARTATLNMMAKYDLEEGYDGVRFEISSDGEEWFPLTPTRDRHAAPNASRNLIGTNPIPLAEGDPMGVPAITGTSAGDALAKNGWIPLTFDLLDVPGLRTFVPIESLTLPAASVSGGISPALGPGGDPVPGIYTSPSLKTAESRWEVRNEGELQALDPWMNDAWWSGFTQNGATFASTVLSRKLELSEVPEKSDLVITWWDRRAGTTNTTWTGVGGAYSFRTDVVASRPVCSDGVDNDNDGLADSLGVNSDTGCNGPNDMSELDLAVACDDGIDNDGDGRIDWNRTSSIPAPHADPGCISSLDNDEREAALVCDNGQDEDVDGVADYPQDPGCAGPADPDSSEAGGSVNLAAPACSDGWDDDTDGKIDYPADRGCESEDDESERGNAACDNGMDDDRDGVADFPNDPGCNAHDDSNERRFGAEGAPLLRCDDGADNDGDFAADFGNDPGCLNRGENTANAERKPQGEGIDLRCDNTMDDDGDSKIDYPADTTCAGPGDATEAGAARQPLATMDSVRMVERKGDWVKLSLRLPFQDGPRTPGSSLTLAFALDSKQIGTASTGWFLRDIRISAVQADEDTGVLHFTPLNGESDTLEELLQWTSSTIGNVVGFRRVCPSACPGVQSIDKLPVRAAPWEIVNEVGPDGKAIPVWKLNLVRNQRSDVDARVVSPIVDLSRATSGNIQLDVTHKYSLNAVSIPVPHPNNAPGIASMSRWYQAGTIEVEVQNDTSGQWEWHQVFAKDSRPSTGLEELQEKMGPGFQGAPYNHTLLEVGDTFERFPRLYDQWHQRATTSGEEFDIARTYIRPVQGNVSYAFSGKSQGPASTNGFVTDTFDLSQFAGRQVRIGLHGWTGGDGTKPTGGGSWPGASHHWTVASMVVKANVLQSPDAHVRVRLGTDESILPGEFSFDRFEVTGLRNDRSVGLDVTQKPTQMGADGTVTIRGNVTNYASSDRPGLALGVRVVDRASGEEAFLNLSLGGQTQVSGGLGDHFPRAIRLPTLKAAGLPGSTVPFALDVFSQDLGAVYEVELQALESLGSGYEPVTDDLPGRTGTAWRLAVVDVPAVRFDPLTFTTTTIGGSKRVIVNATGQNVGTIPLNLSIRFDGVRIGGDALDGNSKILGEVAPGARFSAESDPIAIPPKKEANYEFRAIATAPDPKALPGAQVTDLPIEGAVRTGVHREGTGEVILASSFEEDMEGWSAMVGMGSPIRLDRTRDDARFGAWSLLHGYNDTQYALGARAMGHTAILTSPVFDLRAAPLNATLAFWHKPQLDKGRVDIWAESKDPTFTHMQRLNSSMPGRQEAWSYVRIPLDVLPLSSSKLWSIRFVIFADDQGYRLDALTISGERLEVRPLNLTKPISDAATKRFPIEIKNPGFVERTINVSISNESSTLTAEQRRWVEVSPPNMTLPPGGKGTAHVTVTTPPAFAAFPQKLTIGLNITPLDQLFDGETPQIHLDFRPEPRPDLVATVSIDGDAASQDEPSEVEEGVPHELSVSIANFGGADSAPTPVALSIVDLATGKAVWNDSGFVDRPLVASLDGSDSFLLSTSWTPTLGRLGDYELRVTVDPRHSRIDFDRRNDDITIPLRVVPLLRPDILVDSDQAGVSSLAGRVIHEAQPGDFVRVHAAIRNVGSTPAPDVTVRIIAGSAVLKEERIGTLAPNQTVIAETNHIVPANTTVYRIIAFTDAPERNLVNNALTLTLPVFPPDVTIEAPEGLAFAPGTTQTVSLNVTDASPYPQLVRLNVTIGAGLATIVQPEMALAPGESRDATLRLTIPATMGAGRHSILVRSQTENGAQMQRTVEFDVLPEPALDVSAYPFRGRAGEARASFDATNAGNVPLAPGYRVLRGGSVVADGALETLQPGQTRFESPRVALPHDSPPGEIGVTIVLLDGEAELARANGTIEILPWINATAKVESESVTPTLRTYTVGWTFDGNAPANLTPTLRDAPAGVRARFEPATLAVEPGGFANLTVTVTSAQPVDAGLYGAQVELLDTDRLALTAGAVDVKLDFRRPHLDLVTAAHEPSSAIEAGDGVLYRAVVRNLGTKPAQDVPVELYVDDALVGRWVLASLQPGESSEIRARWNATPGTHSIVLTARAPGAPASDGIAFAEQIHVESGGIVGGIDAVKSIPAPPPVLALALALALALVLRRKRI